MLSGISARPTIDLAVSMAAWPGSGTMDGLASGPRRRIGTREATLAALTCLVLGTSSTSIYS